MEQAILYRFADVQPAHVERLRMLRHFNPDVPVHGLYVGEEFLRAHRNMRDAFDTFWIAPSFDPVFKRLHADYLTRLWFTELGQHESFDVLYDHDGHLLLTAPLNAVYPPMAADTVGLSGMSDTVDWVRDWIWTSGTPRRDMFTRFCQYMSDRYGMGLQKVIGLWPGTVLGRRFLDAFIAEPYPLDIFKHVHCEIILGAFAEALGFTCIDTGLHPRSLPGIAGVATGVHFHTDGHQPVSIDTIKRNMIRSPGLRHFAFFPVTDCIRLEDLPAAYV